MFKRLALKLAVRLLRDPVLTLEDRSLLTATVLDRLNALPADAILKTDTDGTLVLNGKRIDAKKAIALNKSAQRVLNEQAFKYGLEQIRFAAIEIGIYKGLTTEQNVFAKAALWQIEEYKKLLQLLSGGAQQEEDLDDDD